jgi:hypothetical protein
MKWKLTSEAALSKGVKRQLASLNIVGLLI